MKTSQRIRLGIFMMIGLFLLLLTVAFFTARKLLEKRDNYYVLYTDMSVSGLEVGSPVKYLGISVGSISEIYIDPLNVNAVIVKLSLRSGTPVKVDAVADIVSIGITGLKTIEIRGGSQEAEFLQAEEYIQAGTSLADEITGKAEVIAYKVEDVLNNLQAFTHPDNMARFTETVNKIGLMVDNTSATFYNINQLIDDNRTDIREIVLSTRQLSSQLDSTSVELFAAIEKFNELMQSDTLMSVLGNFLEISNTLKETNLDELIEALANTTIQTQMLLVRLGEDIDRGGESLNDNLMLLQYSLHNLNDLSRKLNTNPSLLLRGKPDKGIPDRMLDDQRDN